MQERKSNDFSVFGILVSFALSFIAFYIVLVFGYILVELVVSFILNFSFFQFISRSKIGHALVTYFLLIVPLYFLCIGDYKLISLIMRMVNRNRSFQICKSYFGLGIVVGIVGFVQLVCVFLNGADLRLCILALISSFYFLHKFSELKEA